MPKQDSITLLKADHAAVKKLFAQEEKATEHDGPEDSDSKPVSENKSSAIHAAK